MSEIEVMAYAATMKASSADASVTTTFSTGNHKIDETSTESGPVSWAANEAQFKTTISMNGIAQLTIRQIIEGNHAYSRLLSPVHIPGSLASLVPDLSGWEETTWSGTSSDDSSQLLSTLFLGPGGQGNVLNPAPLLALLEAHASSIRNLGSAVLDGVSTTHYRALIPLSRLGDISPAELRQARQVLGSSSLSFDYWIDSGGLLRQLRFGISLRQPRQPKGTPSPPGQVTLPISYPISASTTLRLSNYGTPVDIVLPTSSQITSQVSCTASSSGFDCSS